MNEKLKKLYQEKWEQLISHAHGTSAAYPLLIQVDDKYQNADIRVMIVGQETDGWGGKLEENKWAIEKLQQTYFDYRYLSKDKHKRAFWNRKNFRFYEENLAKKVGINNKKIAFIWNNVHKIGKTTSGRPTQKIRDLEKQFFDVFEQEIMILLPDIIIFTSGDRTIPLKHSPLSTVSKTPVIQVYLTDFPNIIAVRTYHPNARIKGGKKHLKHEVLDLLEELLINKSILVE